MSCGPAGTMSHRAQGSPAATLPSPESNTPMGQTQRENRGVQIRIRNGSLPPGLRGLLITACVLSVGLGHTVAAGSEHLLEVDATKSAFVAITRRAGLLAFLGHDHAIIAKRWRACVRYNPSDVDSSSAELTVQADSLVIDSAEARRTAELDSGGPGPEDIRDIQKQMLGPDVLHTARYPTIQYNTVSVEASEEARLTLKGRLTLHGTTRDVTALVAVEETEAGALRFFGTLTFSQSDFGITPASVAGVVKVKDEVEIRFDLFSATPHGSHRDRP